MSVAASSWALARPWSDEPRREARFLYGIAFWLALIQVSIAASQIVLAVLLCIWAYRVARGELSFPRLSMNKPLALYALLSFAAALVSFDPAMSLHASRKLLLLMVPLMLVSSVRHTRSVETLVLVLILVADIGALVGLWQYFFGELGGIDHRIHGFMGHYMTYSGLLMSVGIFAIAGLMFRGSHRAFFLGSVTVIGLALVLTLTRSAWIGIIVATLTLAFLRDRRLLLLAPILALAAITVLPRGVEQRLGSFLTPDTSGMDRIYMLESGMQMVANHPWLGVGLNMVEDVYPIYRMPEAPLRKNPHLHNNIAQIAAERGLPCLLAWLSLIVVTFAASARAFERARHDPRERALAAGALGVMLASFLAGQFEYNFGDSEFQMLFLFAMTVPWMLGTSSEPNAPNVPNVNDDPTDRES
ncbi:MAG: O-antigen ligase family protein [Acidobacteria bacterium]|nr:MAG: O-antigen ligase family protein [Acidobacteriota bacterium]